MRIKSFFLGMLLMCSFAALPVLAQDDDHDDSEVPEFMLEEDQAVSVEGGGDDSGTMLEGSEIADQLRATKSLYITVRGHFLYAVWNGRVLVVYCDPCSRCVCVRIGIHWRAADSTSPVP